MVNRIGYAVVILLLLGLGILFYGGIFGASDTVVVADTAVVDPAGSGDPITIGSVTVGPAGLVVPVAGVRAGELVDTFTQARAGGARVHDAIDIMAPVGRPIVSSAPGTVEKLFFSRGGGGTSVYIRSLDGKWVYYYAHLNAYAPGLHEGQRVGRGTLIGFVGFSGNADPAGPHLHMAINRMQPGEKWHQGRPVNPYPLLAGNAARR